MAKKQLDNRGNWAIIDNMNRAKQAKAVIVKVLIPFETEEGARFREFLAVRGAKAGPFVRQLLLTAMDSAAGPIVEAAMRGRAVPDLGAGQARELAEELMRTGSMRVPLGSPASVVITTDAFPQQSIAEFAESVGTELGLRR